MKTAHEVFDIIVDATQMSKAPEGHYCTYLDEHFDFTVIAETIEEYVQRRIKEALSERERLE